MTSSKNFGKTRLIVLLAGVTLMSLALALASSTPVRAGDATPDNAWYAKGPAPAMAKAPGTLVVKQTGLKVTMSLSHDNGKGGPVPTDLPFGPNVRVWDDPAQQTNPSIVKDSVSGLVAVAFQHFNGADWDIYLGVSADDGTTWNVGPLVNTAANENNPSLAVTSTGAFALAYQDDSNNKRMNLWQSLDGLTWTGLALDFTPTSPFTDPAFPNVVTETMPIGAYPSGVMFAWQTYCTDATNCGGGSHTAYWYGSSDWTQATPAVDLGGSYWLVDPVRVDRFGLSDVLHPSAGWSSAGYFMAIDDQGYTAAERRATWLVLDEPATTASNEWIQNWWSQDPNGCYPVMGATGTNVVIISTIRNNTVTSHPTDHRAIFFTSSDGWGNVLNADWIDATASNQQAFSVTGIEQAGTTTLRTTYYSNSVVSSMDTTDVGVSWNGPLKVSDNAGSGVNDYKATSIWIDSSGAPKVAWQDNRDGNVNIYTTGYLTYQFWVNSTCGGVASNMKVLVDGSQYVPTPLTGRWTAGTSHTLQITQQSQDESFCKRCAFVRWSDGSTNPLKNIPPISGAFSITAEFDDMYRTQLTTTPVPLQLTWKGTTGNTPIVSYERPGTYTAIAPTPQNGPSPDQRYVFQNWSDGTTQATKSVTVGTTCLNLTANYGIEYQVTIQTNPPGMLVGYDTTPMANAPVYFWTASGVRHMVITQSPQPPNPVDTRYRFDRWAGGPTDWGWNVTVMGANTYTANFVTQYLINIRANIENPGPTVGSDIPGCDSQMPAPLRCWADQSSSPNLILLSPQLGAGSRYVFQQWNDGNLQLFRPIGPISGPATYMSMWSAEYLLTMTMDTSCQGTLSATPPPANGWHPQGESVSIDWTAPVMPAGERYTWWRWEGTGVGSYTGTIQSASIAMNDAIVQTAFCHHEFQVTLDTSPVPLDYTVSSGAGDMGVNGQRVYWWGYMTTHWFNVTQTTQSGGAGKQYVFNDWSDSTTNPNHAPFTVGASTTYTARFKTQYKVTLSQVPTTPAGLGGLSCSNPDCWFDEGGPATVSVTSQTYPPSAQWYRYAFSSWSGQASGNALSYTFPAISEAKTATANWALWYKISVTSAQAAWTCTPTDCWQLSGQSMTVAVTSPFPQSATGTRYVLTGWTGDPGSGLNTFIITMDSSKNVTATWKTQYQLTIISQCGGQVCGTPTQTNTDGWYDSGLTAIVTVTSSETVGGTKYNFDGWAGDATGTATTASIVMDAAKTATANWKEEPKQQTSDLTVWIILIVVIIVVVVLVAILMMKRKKSPVEEELPPEEIPPAPPAKTAPPPAKPVSQAPPRPAAPPPTPGPSPKPQAPPPAKK